MICVTQVILYNTASNYSYPCGDYCCWCFCSVCVCVYLCQSKWLLSFTKGLCHAICCLLKKARVKIFFACIDSKNSGYLGIETGSSRLQGIARMGRVEI